MNCFEEARKYNREHPSQVRIVKALPADDPSNYLHVELAVGDILTKYRGATYGCIDYNQGIPLVIGNDPYATPFGQINYEYFEEIPRED